MKVKVFIISSVLLMISPLFVGCDHQNRPAEQLLVDSGLSIQPIRQSSPVPLSISDIVVVDIWGTRRMATEFAADIGSVKNQAMVFIFMGTECPVARVYVPTLIEMEKSYRAQGVQFVGVFSNAGENLLEIAQFAHEYELPFPVVKDTDAQLADCLAVERTPDVVVVDDNLKVVYRGLVNDQYRAGGRKSMASRHYLRDALDQHLAGQPIDVPKTLATGCHIDRRLREPADPSVTYSEHVAPIVQQKCQSCHRPGQIGPFPLVTYEEVRRHVMMIDEVVTDRRMPPLAGTADEEFGDFTNHPVLTDEEVETIATWCRSGAGEGDPAKAPPPIEWASVNLIADPDVVLEMEKAADIPADGTLGYRYFQIQSGFEQDKWVTECEVVPSNPAVVHHALAHITGRRKQLLFGIGALQKLNGYHGEKSRLVGQYTVGDGLVQYPTGMAMRVPARSYITLEVHYMPNGRATQDRTSVLLKVTDQPPEHRVRSIIFNKRSFNIPANDPYVRLDNSWRFEKDSLILSIRPHMHRRGKHWSYTLRYPDGREASLLKVPRWHYDWQLGAIFKTPVRVPAGTEMLITAIYDNSVHNPYNPDPNVDVHWGLQDVNEMMAGGMRIVEF